MAKDYYQTLGVKKDASAEEIKRAYYKMAHQYHPDKGGGDEKKFKEVNEAYQVLSDKEKRSQYDQFGQAFDGGMPSDFPGQDGSGFQWSWGGGPNVDIDMEFGDLGDVMEEMFGFGRQTRRKDIKRGKDIEVDFEISLEDTLKGRDRTISLEEMAQCPRCQGKGGEPGTKIKECFSCRGTGQVQQIVKTVFGSFTRSTVCPECQGEGYRPEKPCNVCKGEGRVKNLEEIRFFVPSGVDANQVIKVEGKGEAGRKGGKAGDLYVRIFVKSHPVFERKGDDLYTSFPVSFSQASLGDEIELSTLEGAKILLKIPEGMESGKVLRISGKGIPHFSGMGRGNLYVELIVKTPKRITKKQKELLEQMKKEGL
ncbi:MAG: molecular chaperone DnaJ [Candidatus Nealsonbacteria bacterium RIFCSPLOWO2_01_FULL_41_9]|uniref:Chaperone protein DnaJ n=1 Tax=Candidatus Nealsonbacteria bacterium RIFCSPLOWO2_01_FULL_41_9 TaxID=1801671 RepID=A0A1G2EAM5_9BACT|nr:MAG: molecular chaperone DnaJ [Candidatus Nealsonbacteria bacterium RIFCSPLOWO2_01_FULL_41_9]